MKQIILDDHTSIDERYFASNFDRDKILTPDKEMIELEELCKERTIMLPKFSKSYFKKF